MRIDHVSAIGGCRRDTTPPSSGDAVVDRSTEQQLADAQLLAQVGAAFEAARSRATPAFVPAPADRDWTRRYRRWMP